MIVLLTLFLQLSVTNFIIHNTDIDHSDPENRHMDNPNHVHIP